MMIKSNIILLLLVLLLLISSCNAVQTDEEENEANPNQRAKRLRNKERTRRDFSKIIKDSFTAPGKQKKDLNDFINSPHKFLGQHPSGMLRQKYQEVLPKAKDRLKELRLREEYMKQIKKDKPNMHQSVYTLMATRLTKNERQQQQKSKQTKETDLQTKDLISLIDKRTGADA